MLHRPLFEMSPYGIRIRSMIGFSDLYTSGISFDDASCVQRDLGLAFLFANVLYLIKVSLNDHAVSARPLIT